jgi:carbonic anhydrase/acetyltransferase-like protein (isoleucine patch superfamily)
MISTAFHLEPIHTDQYVVMGDVVIAAGVAIAPGVLLQADSGSRIVLGSGICLGMGCVVHASGGEIRIDAGVNLGAGVLIVGATTIGPGAIVGAGTTIFGEAIGPGQLVPPNSLLAKSIGPTVIAPEPVEVSPPVEVPQSVTAAPPETPPKIGTEGNTFFYSKSNSNDNAIEDPWAAAAAAVTPAPIPMPIGTPIESTFVDPQGSYFSGTGFSAASDFSGTAAPGTGTPVASTYVYPDSGYQPKHPWEVNANTDLGNPPNNAAVTAPTPNPDSDLSAAEMQNGAQPPLPDSGYLVPQTPKQVYGQAYVNQMLGRMNGKKY